MEGVKITFDKDFKIYIPTKTASKTSFWEVEEMSLFKILEHCEEDLVRSYLKLSFGTREEAQARCDELNSKNSDEKETTTKPMSEIPNTVLRLLYFLRPHDAFKVPFDVFVRRYEFIVVDDVAYYSEDCDMSRITKYLDIPGPSILRAQIPDAIVSNGYVLKNRFGYNS